MIPIAFMAKCQKLSVYEQYLKGARLFDLRVRFTNDGKPIICHGLVEYDTYDGFIDKVLKDFNECTGVYFRVVLETTKQDVLQEVYFQGFCRRLVKDYPNITFFGGNNREDWSGRKVIYKFPHDNEKLIEKYSSTTSLLGDNKSFLRYLDDWWPWLYARLHNHKNIKDSGESEDWLFLDFIGL